MVVQILDAKRRLQCHPPEPTLPRQIQLVHHVLWRLVLLHQLLRVELEQLYRVEEHLGHLGGQERVDAAQPLGELEIDTTHPEHLAALSLGPLRFLYEDVRDGIQPNLTRRHRPPLVFECVRDVGERAVLVVLEIDAAEQALAVANGRDGNGDIQDRRLHRVRCVEHLGIDAALVDTSLGLRGRLGGG
jgi:hypothetical protein